MESNAFNESRSNPFGSLKDVDFSDIPDATTQNVDPQSMSIDDFKRMAMNMANVMKPEQAQNLKEQVEKMPIDLGTIRMMLQMRQFAPLRMMMKNKQDDINFLEAAKSIMTYAETATPREQVQIGQLMLSLPVPTYHDQAQSMLDAAATLKQPKSTKSARLRARRERLRKQRMSKKKKK